jgi:hypothetical protein
LARLTQESVLLWRLLSSKAPIAGLFRQSQAHPFFLMIFYIKMPRGRPCKYGRNSVTAKCNRDPAKGSARPRGRPCIRGRNARTGKCIGPSRKTRKSKTWNSKSSSNKIEKFSSINKINTKQPQNNNNNNMDVIFRMFEKGKEISFEYISGNDMDAITDTLYTKYNIEYKQISFVGENEEKIIIHGIDDKIVPLGKKIPIKLPNNGQRTWTNVEFLFKEKNMDVIFRMFEKGKEISFDNISGNDLEAITDTLSTKYDIEYKQIRFVGENEENIMIHGIDDKIDDKIVPLGKKIPIKLPKYGERTWTDVEFLFEKE